MSIEWTVDAVRKIVFASPRGELTGDDLRSYQKDAWSHAELKGFHELVDMAAVTAIAYESFAKVRELADLSARMDDPGVPTKLAIVAASDAHFGMGRMYQSLRELDPRSTREVRVFRDRGEALRWLEEPPSPLPGAPV